MSELAWNWLNGKSPTLLYPIVLKLSTIEPPAALTAWWTTFLIWLTGNIAALIEDDATNITNRQ